MKKERITAIVLAGGSGNRMGSTIPKQYIELNGYPVIYYSLKVFQESFIDDIILVVKKGNIEYCQSDIVNRYHFSKVKKIVEGGKERVDSVYNGIHAVDNCTYLYIHDGARPFINKEIIENSYAEVKVHKACVIGMPSKDTIKICDEKSFVLNTPDRDKVWQIQTPQVFEFNLIKSAYENLYVKKYFNVTDDASVVELTTNTKVKMVKGSYNNIKITTAEDLIFAEGILKNSLT